MSFDALAPLYRPMEFFLAGEILQIARTAFLARIAAPKNILILGEGNGRFLGECRRHFPETKITVVDASRRMLDLARERLVKRGDDCRGIDFIFVNALEWTAPAGAFDLIVTHFFLDCFRPEQLDVLIANLSRAGTPDAQWLLADFQLAIPGWRRVRSRLILWSLYRFFRAATRISAHELTPPDALLERHGFQLRERIIYDWGLLHSDWWQRA